jgi:hypothetical protein
MAEPNPGLSRAGPSHNAWAERNESRRLQRALKVAGNVAKKAARKSELAA